VKPGVGALAKAVTDRTAQELISGRGLNSAAARGEPNLTGKLPRHLISGAKPNIIEESSFNC